MSMRILLVEDDNKVAAFVCKGLKEAGFAVDHVASGDEALDYGMNLSYDLIVLDIMLPGRDGLELLEYWRKRRVPTPVLLLSAKHSVDDRVRGLQLGGDDYLTKPFAFSELLARIQAIRRRASAGFSDPNTLTVGDLELNLHTREARRGTLVIPLQNKEFELLEYLMRNAGMVVSKTMIIEHVWNYNFDPMTNIVEARISKLREKLDKPFVAKLIHTMRGAGYMLRPDNE
jgi:two-component system, OmpR family, response regulator